MPCYHPLRAWRGKVSDSGKRAIVFKAAQRCESLVDSELKLPCGQCIGCRLERSRQWAFRCVNEASLYKDNCFLTLTYDDAHLPPGGSLCLRDFQLFMKRLRKEAGIPGIRFFIVVNMVRSWVGRIIMRASLIMTSLIRSIGL